MATKPAVSAALKLLSRAFAGTVDSARADVYLAALDDMTDADLALACEIAIKTWEGEFIPPPAILRRAVAPAPLVVDAPALIRKIEKLATYNPNCGMVYPPTDVVREKLGAEAAYAYAAAGGPRLYAENETTRQIAEREFQKSMVEAYRVPGVQLPVIGAGSTTETKRLSPVALPLDGAPQ